MRNYIIIGVVVAVLLGAAASFFMKNGTPVEAAAAKVGPVRETIDERGKTRLPRVYDISMPINGRVEAINLVEGTPVKRDQVVARVVPADLKLTVDAATAAVERLDASLKENDDASVENVSLQQAYKFVESMDRTVEAAKERVRAGAARLEFEKRHYERIDQLWKQKTQTDEQHDQARLSLVQADVEYQQDQLVLRAMEAMRAATFLMPTSLKEYIGRKQLTHGVLERQKKEAQVELQQVEQDVERGTMRSPIDGVVLERASSEERVVTAGTVLLKIGNLNDLEVEVDVLSQEVVKVKKGQPCEIFGPAIGDMPLRGAVQSIYPAGFTKVSSLGVEQQRVKVIIQLNSEDKKRLIEQRATGTWDLGVDYRVRARIITAEKPDALFVPRSALFRGADGEWQVFVIRDGKSKLQAITTGLMNDQQVQVLKGIASGEL
ncbi:MAG: HlyD family efflux transporter periplasmic adaptor subunit, partial [Planctomycetota bacterium]|nr:HlyD family efflux transporter periplasmic adaptor subunit [Planctomycetota bacterium]